MELSDDDIERIKTREEIILEAKKGASLWGNLGEKVHRDKYTSISSCHITPRNALFRLPSPADNQLFRSQRQDKSRTCFSPHERL